MSYITSIHDYENLCALGITRPPWCIRSWKGYTDMETYIHDDSIVSDRRRDTLTSTTTGTTLSSDFSDVTYTDLPFRKFMAFSRQDDYLDTFIYDLMDWESLSNRSATAEFFTGNNNDFTTKINNIQEQTNFFSAKPIVINEKDGMFTLNTVFKEPENHNNLSKYHMSLKKPKAYSVSSLVGIIDEISKGTVENSPRHVYHRTESNWEDMEQKILMKKSHLTKVLLNNYSNVTFSHNDPWFDTFISDSNNEKLDIIREMTNYCLHEPASKTPLINAILSDSPILGPKTNNHTCESTDLMQEDNLYINIKLLDIQV